MSDLLGAFADRFFRSKEIPVSYPPSVNIFSEQFDQEIVEIKDLVNKQNGDIKVLVHPLFNLYKHLDRTVNKNEFEGFSKKFLRALKANNKIRLRNLLSDVPRSVIGKFTGNQQQLINIKRSNYYRDLAIWAESTPEEIILLAEEQENFDNTSQTLRILGYKGKIIFYNTRVNDSIPDGFITPEQGFAKLGEKLQQAEVSKMEVAGQNMDFDYQNRPHGCAGMIVRMFASQTHISNITFPQTNPNDISPSRIRVK